ncbi:membrane protein [Flavobacterium suaedae]|uniref:Membrane protein n=1 Tax=Flavobacterium suaedae TaxID=1767027 RepID=A0ABQ1JH92_9FLAO|nr:BamA/TamA family outer membrane protein [Flavobacterium suaedae]GGB67157.1 membrane protein [Flavobacterium suaedae]
MRNNPIIYILLVIFAFGCSNTKYLPEGEMLYTGAEVKVKDSTLSKSDRKEMEQEMEDLLRPRPNRKILGLRAKLYFYNIAGEPKKNKGFRHWLKNKVGEPPVLFSQVDMDYNADLLQNYAENKGYFKTRTSADSTSHNRRASVDYTVTTGKRYTIRNVNYPPADSTKIDSVISGLKRWSILKSGNPYDLGDIKEQREQIDKILKYKGYYYFNLDYLLVQVDSTIGNKQVDLFLKVKEETPEKAKQVYTINDIYIYPNYSISDKEQTINPDKDSITVYKDFKIIDPDHTFRPVIYDRTLYFKKGDIYNRKDHNLSLNRLVNLGVFKFVKNEFRPADSTNTLNAYYYLSPYPKKSIRVELLGKTNSANYNGTELNVNWSNRNIFGGAELLTLSVFGGMEVQVAGQNKGYNVYRVGGEASLDWPRFITPFKVHSASGFVPHTQAKISYEYQNRRKLYSLNSFRAQFGYKWKENIKKEHNLNVFDINYVSPATVTDLYRERIDGDPSLKNVIEKQLIFGPTYSYNYTNTMQEYKRHTFYYKGSLDLSGTLTGLLSGANVKKGDTIRILDVPFSQFIKMEHDFRYYLKLSRNSQLANRIIVGVGMPYGNSGELPYIRQFFSGGTNSLRGFRARSIGPGTYRDDIDEGSFLPDQSGDLKLELNTEYRATIYKIIEGAVFVDAGNIWLWNDNRDEDGNIIKPDGRISKDFYKQLAVDTGIGLRFDFSFLILRTDLAFPIRKPWLPEGDRWVLDRINFGSSTWRKENLVFNLAIGYPF